MADAVAIVSIVSGAVVGLGVPLISARNERGRILLQAEHARLDELTVVLDRAADAVAGARIALVKVLDELYAGHRGSQVTCVAEYRTTVDDVWAMSRKLAVRLGVDDPITDAYRSAALTLSEAPFIALEDDATPDALLAIVDRVKPQERRFYAATSRLLRGSARK